MALWGSVLPWRESRAGDERAACVGSRGPREGYTSVACLKEAPLNPRLRADLLGRGTGTQLQPRVGGTGGLTLSSLRWPFCSSAPCPKGSRSAQLNQLAHKPSTHRPFCNPHHSDTLGLSPPNKAALARVWLPQGYLWPFTNNSTASRPGLICGSVSVL